MSQHLKSATRFRASTWLQYGVLAVAAALVGWRLEPNILGDDAAITLRYVERLVGGHGFTYNDHEHVLGTSNPLYVLLLSVIARNGIGGEAAARGLGLLLFVTAVLLTLYCTTLLSSSRLAGLLAGILLVAEGFFRYHALSGMESILAVFLGLAVVAAILNGNETATGIFLGLAVWNKLDAGLLAIAVAAAWVLIKGRFPIRVAVVSAAVILPWAVFAQYYFGSPVPNSLIVKLEGSGPPFDHLWVIDFLLSNGRWCLVLLALAAFGVLRPLSERARLAALTLGGWFLLHATALSLVDLGDYYPWYLTVLLPPPIILACTAIGRILHAPLPPYAKVPLGVAMAFLLGLATEGPVMATYRHLASGSPIEAWEAFDNDRRMAGIFLDQFAAGNEVVASSFGWVAFEARRPFNDTTRLNSRRFLEPDLYLVSHGVPWTERNVPPVGPAGFEALATFNLASDLFPGYSWFTVFGRADAHITRHGPRYVQYRLSELPPARPWSTDHGLEHVKIDGTNLMAHPPSGATFEVDTAGQAVHLVFTPAFVETVPLEKTDGVTFEVWTDDLRRYHRLVLPTDKLAPVILPLAEPGYQGKVSLSLVTSPGPRNDTDWDWAYWRSVKAVVGEAALDLTRLRNLKLVNAWTEHNPSSPGTRQ
jgi:hypothetical protein